MKLESAFLCLAGFALVHCKSVVEHQVRVLDQETEDPRATWKDASLALDDELNQTAVTADVAPEMDPLLRPMPEPFSHFHAYTRADISSFYQEPAGSRVEQEPAFPGQAGKFVNMSPERLELHW